MKNRSFLKLFALVLLGVFVAGTAFATVEAPGAKGREKARKKHILNFERKEAKNTAQAEKKAAKAEKKAAKLQEKEAKAEETAKV